MLSRHIIYKLIFLQVLICFSCSPSMTSNIINDYKNRADNIPHNWKDESVISLDETIDISFQHEKDGNEAIIKETEWIYVNKRFPNDFETITFYENEFINKIQKIDVRVFYPNNQTYHISTDMPDKINREKIIEGDYRYSVYIPGYCKGVLIRIEFISKYHRPEFVSRFTLRHYYPIQNKIIRFKYPEDSKINFGLENTEKLTLTHTEKKDNGYNIYEVLGDMISKKTGNTRIDMPENWFASLNFSLPPEGKISYSWKELGDHYLKIVEDSIVRSKKIENCAKELAKDSKSKKQIIKKSFHEITKRVRYYADEQGKYGFIPRETTDIFDKGYGDCKEISSLLKVLLESNNISSNLALVRTYDYPQLLEKYPNLGSFNHMIATYEDDDKKINFLDGTNSHSHALNSCSHLIGRKTFLLIPGNSRIDVIRKPKDFRNEVNTVSTLNFNKEKKEWMVSGKISIFGKAALDFYNIIQQTETTEKNTIASAFVQNCFGINPLNIQFKAPDSDSVTFSYNASFQNNYISLEKGGFKLSVPTLYKYKKWNIEKKIVGRQYFREFTQKDSWVFPKKITEISEEYDNAIFSNGKFIIKNKKVTRQYTQLFKEHALTKKQYETLRKNQNKIIKTVVWF